MTEQYESEAADRPQSHMMDPFNFSGHSPNYFSFCRACGSATQSHIAQVITHCDVV